jgi:uncharacterized protein GlcG (DUF336 family)
MLTQKTISLDQAMAIIKRAVDYANEKNHVGIACVVMNKDGEVIASAKMDNRSARFYKAAYRKAYSAAVFERDTSAIVDFHEESMKHGHRGPREWNDTMLTTLPAGYVIMQGNDVLGAMAVAGGGGSPETSDLAIADVAFSALGEGFHHKPGSARH